MVILPFFNKEKYKTIFDIINDHALAKLGDVFANLIYSLAISASMKHITSKKVSAAILGNAFRRSNFGKYVHVRSDLHTLADFSEALICFSILGDFLDVEKCKSILETKLIDIDINDRSELNIKSINAFQFLLDHIFTLLVNVNVSLVP